VNVAEVLGLSAAAFAAGAINSVAGGGSLISFPALIAAGYSAKTANVTNTVALWPGYLGGSVNYRGELRRQRRRVLVLMLPAVLGALAGSAILLTTSADTFEVIVPFLVLFASGLMFFQERLTRFAADHHLHSRGGDHVPVALLAITFIGAVYGAYFGAGMSIVMLAFLAILLPDDMQHSNALKGMLALIINAVAVLYFAAFGPVEWRPAVLMAVAALAGGYLGVYVARALGTVWLRRAVVVYGVIVSIVLLVRL
jgi:uncharacterized membrane protein YfcA